MHSITSLDHNGPGGGGHNGNAIIGVISKIVVLSITIGATWISLEIPMQILKEGWGYVKYAQDHLLLGKI